MRSIRFRQIALASWASLALASSLAACGGEAGDKDGVEAPPSEAPIVRPASVEELSLELSAQELPEGLVSGGLLVASDVALGVAAGGEGGLFVQGAGGLERVDEAPVSGLVAIEGVGFLVGGQGGLKIWDGALKDTTLDEALAGASVTALATRGAEVWIGTEDGLLVFDGASLLAFEGLGGASAIHAFEGSTDVLLVGVEGALSVLRQEGQGWSLHGLDGEPVQVALPGAGGRILGLDEGALVERVSVSPEAAAWRAVALSEDAGDTGAAGIEAMAVDPASGAVWVVSAEAIARLEGGAVAVGERPEGLGGVDRAQVTGDGALWLSDGVTLWSAGGQAEVVGFEDRVAGFGEDNCARCHGDGGVAHVMVSYEQWVAEAEQIVDELESGRMPADGRPLVGGGAELVRRWIEGGFAP